MPTYEVVDEFKVSGKDLFILTLNERMPMSGHFTHCRIDGKEYEILRTHYRASSPEKALDLMLRNIGINAPGGIGFVGKAVEFV